MNEGHGFSRATALVLMRALAPEVRLSNLLWRTQKRKDMTLPYSVSKSVPRLLKPSSAQILYGTASPCPSFDRVFPRALRVSESFMCCPAEKLIRTDLIPQPSLQD